MSVTSDNSFDVVVVGGGVSGVLAAVAASRSGARTILIEKNGILGGTGVSALLKHICGLYLNEDKLPIELINKGIINEVVDGLYNLSIYSKVIKIGKVFVLPYRSIDLRYLLSSLCLSEPNLTVLLSTSAFSVSCAGGGIKDLQVYSQGNIWQVYPEVVIDCTGSGDIAYMAGASFELSPGSELQFAGYTIRLREVYEQDDTLSIKVPYYLTKAVEEGVLPSSFRYTSYSSGDHTDEGYCKFSIEGDISEVLVEKEVLKAINYLAEKIPSVKTAHIAETSTGVFEREGRRICGEYTLTKEDVLGARKFPDGIVKNSWPIEIWEKNKGPIYQYLKPNDYYEIPFSCLKVKDMHNLLCAGRCISVSHEALGSTRVMGACMALGEQAGLAAAHFSKKGYYPDFGKERP